MSQVRDEKLKALEVELVKVQGVRSARVVGIDTPSEIHIIASPERPPKQVVRDVQSLAAAGFGLAIDHRIVSVVQLSDAPDDFEAILNQGADAQVVSGRPAVQAISATRDGPGTTVAVELRWPDGARTRGEASGPASLSARARTATRAMAVALEPELQRRGIVVDVEQVVLLNLGERTSVIVHAVVYQGDTSTAVIGAALVEDDVARSASSALLQSLNRKLT